MRGNAPAKHGGDQYGSVNLVGLLEQFEKLNLACGIVGGVCKQHLVAGIVHHLGYSRDNAAYRG